MRGRCRGKEEPKRASGFILLNVETEGPFTGPGRTLILIEQDTTSRSQSHGPANGCQGKPGIRREGDVADSGRFGEVLGYPGWQR